MATPSDSSQVTEWFDRHGPAILRVAPTLVILIGIGMIAYAATSSPTPFRSLHEGWVVLFLGQFTGAGRLFYDPYKMIRLRTVGQMVVATIWNTVLATGLLGLLRAIASIQPPSGAGLLMGTVLPLSCYFLVGVQALGLPLYMWWLWSGMRAEELTPTLERRSFARRERDAELALVRMSSIWDSVARVRTQLELVQASLGADERCAQLVQRYNTTRDEAHRLDSTHRLPNWTLSPREEAEVVLIANELRHLEADIARVLHEGSSLGQPPHDN